MVGIAVVSLGTLGYFSLTIVKSVIRTNLESSIVSTLNFHKLNVENHFGKIESKITSLASGFALVQAIHEFEEAVYLIDPDVRTALRLLKGEHADLSSPTPAQELEDSLYKDASLRYGPFFKGIVDGLGVSDLMLIEPDKGFVIYSTSNRAELGLSTVDLGQGKAWLKNRVSSAVADSKLSGSFSAFAPFRGPDDPLSTFIVRPIKDAGQIEGVVAIRISARRLTNLLNIRPDTGLRFSVYALDQEKRIIAASGSGEKKWIGAVGPAGKFFERSGPNGESLLSVSAPLAIGDSGYLLIVEADTTHAFARLGEFKLDLMLAIFLVAVALFISLFVINRSITTPIVAVGEAMKSITSKGVSLRERLPENSNDEIGTLCRLVNDMSQRLETIGNESDSQTRSFDKYAQTLVSKANKLRNEAQKRDALLGKSGDRIKELLEIVETQRKEIKAQQSRLDAGRAYLKKTGEANERFLMVVESGIKEKLGLLLKRAESVLKDSANGQADIFSDIFLDEIREIDELIGKAIAGFAFESDDDPIDLKPVNLSEIGKEAVKDAAELAAKLKLKLEFSHDAKSPMILADPNQIRQAMDCLIENGLKYTPEKGSVHVTVNDTDSLVRFEVRDTGIGVEKENIEKIFQKFYRIENDSDGSVSGTGLGLYICRMIVRRHDGKIGAESEPGKGSSFFFELNRKSAS
jgi:signal transduction histidine kinase